ncbi:MAG: hypothetical protein L0229_05530 [Blastocatellia bacterium]|nr:hypothetical protein [Blastocatellia bacterium]
MPDGDKFERILRGKGWKKAYRQVCSDAPFNMLMDTLISAVAAALRGPLANSSLPKIRDAIYQALKEKARTEKLNFDSQPLADPYRMLTDLLSDIAREDDNSVSTQLAARAGRSVYIEFEDICDSVTIKQVQDHLTEVFGKNVISHQWLARVRDGIVLNNNRTPDEQMDWEENLFKRLSEPMRKMISQMFRTDQKVTVRAPRRKTPQRKMTIEELHKGIAVMEI